MTEIAPAIWCPQGQHERESTVNLMPMNSPDLLPENFHFCLFTSAKNGDESTGCEIEEIGEGG